MISGCHGSKSAENEDLAAQAANTHAPGYAWLPVLARDLGDDSAQNARLAFADRDADVLGASTDSVYSHRVWMGRGRERQGIADLRFPLLSDKTGRIARNYGVLLEEEGVALRGLFIVDPEGVIQYAVTHNLNVGRSVDETLRVLEAIQSGGLCGSDWKPGQAMLA